MQKNNQRHLQEQNVVVPTTTVGTVVDTNDPQQMGRLRVLCPALNDREDAPVKDIPWASYVSPFGGEVQVGKRGPDDDDILGPTSYGMWAIPKVGAQAVVMCLDGRTDHRIWIGCLYGQFLPHTMPHGRYTYNENASSDQTPAGPLDSYERKIQPLSSNLDEAFPSPGDVNYEYQTRAADFQATGVNERQLPRTFSRLPDDQDIPTNTPGSNLEQSRQGYRLSRLDPELDVDQNVTEANYDNMVTSVVSPGFHAISMDDRPENERIRIRTTSGHQVIMDDTNERVYISTAKGNNWIEIDQEGNIDIYTSGKLSVNAEKDINFSTQGSFRVNAGRGIHLKSGKETRLSAVEDMSFYTQTNFRGEATQNILFETSQTDISFKSAKQITMETTSGDINLKSGSSLLASSSAGTSFDASGEFIVGGNTIDLGASGNVTVSGSKIDLNGPSAAAPSSPSAATPADVNPDRLALFPNRKPDHEPWARGGNEEDPLGNNEPLLDYTSPQVGIEDYITGSDGTSSERITFNRGPFWRR
jgi:uncharacterized protein (DUF2345 family)